jgi:hypothetical protein
MKSVKSKVPLLLVLALVCGQLFAGGQRQGGSPAGGGVGGYPWYPGP